MSDSPDAARIRLGQSANVRERPAAPVGSGRAALARRSGIEGAVPRRQALWWGAGLLLIVGCAAIALPLSLMTQRPRHRSFAEGWSASRLRQIGLAAQGHASFYEGQLPRDIAGPDGKPILSWRVAILPFLEEEQLYKEFDLKEPWDGPNNKRLLSRMPRVYNSWPIQNAEKAAAQGLTFYEGFSGARTIFDPDRPKPMKLGDVTDGLSSTILAVEAPDPVEWTRPADIPYDPAGPPPRLRAHWGNDGAHVLWCDGRVSRVRLRQGADFDRKLRLAIQIDDGVFEGLD